MRHIESVEQVVAGSVGEPGARTFYIEVAGDTTEWFLLEKQQVAAFADRSIELAQEAGVTIEGTARQVNPAAIPTFRVGDIGLGVVDDNAAVVLHSVEDDDEPVSFSVSLRELASMAISALTDVASGRLPCPHCNLPIDPSGHVCPTTNGDLRTHLR